MIEKHDLSLRERRHIDKMFYLGSDPLFYERNFDHYRPTTELSCLITPMLEAMSPPWKMHPTDVWTHVGPGFRDANSPKLPRQGWKIHVSATNKNCGEILKKVTAVTLANHVPFKFANDTNTMTLMTSKRWPRGGSGKFVTIYPYNDKQFHILLESLYNALEGYAGSYILSDRRYRDSRCLYYRYGGIIATTERNYLGLQQQVLTSPDGIRSPDHRQPYFDPPHWVTDPYPSSEEEGENNEFSLNDGRFTITNALSFSNTGGVYLAMDAESGREVVVKEARPNVELSPEGKDAVARLMQEEAILKTLTGLRIVPEVYHSFWDWENYYIVIEYLDATSIRSVMLTDSPLLKVKPSRADSEAYYQTYKTMFTSLLQVVRAIHAKGIVIGDLSPTNIMVDKVSKEIRLIDFEGAFEPSSGEMKDLHTPGFRPYEKDRKHDSDFSDDIYAIGAIMLYCIFPFSVMSFIRKDLFTSVLPIVISDIGWWDTPVLEVISRLVVNDIGCDEAELLLTADYVVASPFSGFHSRLLGKESTLGLRTVQGLLLDFLTRNFRSSAKHTLFPIDPFGKETNSLGYGFGATGIIDTLQQCQVDIPPDALDRYRRELEAIDFAELSPGFLVGSAGMAWAFLNSGDAENARRFLDHANAVTLSDAHHSLYHGLAGIGMVNLAAYMLLNEACYLTAARRCGETLKQRAIEDEKGIHWVDDGGIRIGYGYGQSGVALFFLRLSQVLDEPHWKETGRRALDFDLSFGEELESGVVSFPAAPDVKHTYEPYIEEGTSGIAKVAMRFGLMNEMERLLVDAHRKYTGFPGLIYGLAGFVDVLVDGYLYSGDTRYLKMAERPLHGLVDFYIFESEKGFTIPGDNLFRVSCDYATGVAGIVQALHRRIELKPDKFCLDILDVKHIKK